MITLTGLGLMALGGLLFVQAVSAAPVEVPAPPEAPPEVPPEVPPVAEEALARELQVRYEFAS